MKNKKKLKTFIILFFLALVVTGILTRIAGQYNSPRVYSFFSLKVLALLLLSVLTYNLIKGNKKEDRILYSLKKVIHNLFPCLIGVICITSFVSIVNRHFLSSTDVVSLGGIANISQDKHKTILSVYRYKTKNIFEIYIEEKGCLKEEIKKGDHIEFTAKKGSLGFIYVPEIHKCSDLQFRSSRETKYK